MRSRCLLSVNQTARFNVTGQSPFLCGREGPLNDVELVSCPKFIDSVLLQELTRTKVKIEKRLLESEKGLEVNMASSKIQELLVQRSE